MISRRDSKPFLIKFINATQEINDRMPVYSGWEVVTGLISKLSGFVNGQMYGRELDYDLSIIVNATDISRRISESTAFLIGEYPTNLFIKGNYEVVKVEPEYNREIVIRLKKIEGIKIPNLYYTDGENIYSYQLNFDVNENKGYIDKNRLHPFTTETVVWSRKPKTIQQQTYRLRYLSQGEVGVSSQYVKFKELRFEAI